MTRELEPLHGRVVQTWSGPEAVARLAQFGRFSLPDPARFRADFRAVGVDGIQIAEWRSTAFSASLDAADTGIARLDAVVSGRFTYRLRDREYSAEPGSVHLVHLNQPVQMSTQGSVRIVRVLLLEQTMPVWLRDQPSLPDGPLPATTLTTGFVALLERLTTAIRETAEEPPVATARAIAALAVALLEEAIPDDGPSGDLRTRIVAYIDRHLGDPGLGPRRIAAEFDISLRWVHQVFNLPDESVARYIRERRADAVAAQIRAERRWTRVGELASRFGFAGRDQLTRAFKQRYGMTVNDYLDAVVLGREVSPEVR